MTHSKRTPGPWKYRWSGHQTWVIDDNGIDALGTAVDEDDARLIAAAPDMLDALTKLSNEVFGSLPLMEPVARREFGNTNYNILIQRAEEARAIIAKAQSQSL